MPTLEVRPRDTPAERDEELIPVDVDEVLTVHAEIIEDWTAPRQNWDFRLTANGLDVELFHILTFT